VRVHGHVLPPLLRRRLVRLGGRLPLLLLLLLLELLVLLLLLRVPLLLLLLLHVVHVLLLLLLLLLHLVLLLHLPLVLVRVLVLHLLLLLRVPLLLHLLLPQLGRRRRRLHLLELGVLSQRRGHLRRAVVMGRRSRHAAGRVKWLGHGPMLLHDLTGCALRPGDRAVHGVPLPRRRDGVGRGLHAPLRRPVGCPVCRSPASRRVHRRMRLLPLLRTAGRRVLVARGAILGMWARRRRLRRAREGIGRSSGRGRRRRGVRCVAQQPAARVMQLSRAIARAEFG
jgi:hypothetical protein